MASLMSEARRDAFVRRVRLEMAKSSLTREALAQRAACKERTLGNLLAGQSVRDATVAKVARVLGIDLEDFVDGRGGGPASVLDAAGRAGEEYGGYLLSAYEDYIGTYFAYRRAFAEAGGFFRSVYEIDWDDDLNRLRFFELQRFRGPNDAAVSNSHAGGVYISPHTGVLHLLTSFQGALRLVTLIKFRRGDDKLRGLILTQSDRDVFFQPAVSATYLQKIKGRRKNSELDKLVGGLGESDPEFKSVAAEIAEIEKSAVFLAGLPVRTRR